MESRLTLEDDDSRQPQTAVNDADPGIFQPEAALEPDTLRPPAARPGRAGLHPQADRLNPGGPDDQGRLRAERRDAVPLAVNGFEDFTAVSTTSNPVNLSETTDVLLAVTVPPGALTGTAPTLTVQLDGVDPAGNPIPAMVKTAVITAPGTYTVSGGLHSTGLVLPATGKVTAVLGGAGPAATGIQITLTGR